MSREIEALYNVFTHEVSEPGERNAENSGKSLHNGPLSGIRILDLTRLYPGPLATMIMADMGAEVIKIEDTLKPDYMRSFPPYIHKESAGYLAVNRSKRSLAIKLNTGEGQEIFLRLVKSADLVVEQFRPGVLEKIGLDYVEAIKTNPRIIYISLSGYGQRGPYANHAGHDINYIGYSGLLSTTRVPHGGPVLPGGQVADVAGGAYMTVIACLSALWSRERRGVGQKVDVSMLDATLPLMTLQMAHYWATGENPPAWELPLSGGMACYGVYECADGKYIVLGGLEAKFWQEFCKLIGKPEWNEKLMLYGKDADALREEMAELFKTKAREEWIALAGNRDICLTPVWELSEIETDPHIQARQMILEQEHPACGIIKGIGIPLKFSHTSAAPSGPPPVFAQHTMEILSDMGYSKQEIEELQRKNIILTTQSA